MIAAIVYKVGLQTGYKTGKNSYKIGKLKMIRWVLVIFLALVIFSQLLPWLEKLGVGRLPGDVRFTLFGRDFSLPFASTILLSTVVFLVGRFL
jgi:hypothetical protein